VGERPLARGAADANGGSIPAVRHLSLLCSQRRHYDCVVDVRSKEMSNFDCLREARLKSSLHSTRRTAGIGEITPSS
jgi:hypothetical protein